MKRETSVSPVFLVGAARSGTSLLYKVMALHAEATWLSNWVQRFPTRPQLSGLNHISRALPPRRSRVWFGAAGDNAYVYSKRRRQRDRAFPMPAEAETLYATCGVPELAHDRIPIDPVALQRLRTAFEAVARWDRRRVLLSKRIANNRRIDWLLQAFPHARFIEIVRDGRAVAASLSKVDWWEGSDVWWYGGTPDDWRRDGRDPWALCARNWVEEVRVLREGLSRVDGSQVLSISYEALVRDPERVIEEALRFSGLDPERSDWQKALSSVKFPNQNERWRNDLPSDALRCIETVQSSELQAYGYTLSSVTEPPRS